MRAEKEAADRRDLATWGVLVRSFLALAGGETAARLLGFVALIVMTRELGPAGFGLVTLGTTLVLWFGLVMDSGTEILNLRDIAREPHRFREIAEKVLGLRLAMCGLAAIGYAIVVVLVAETASDRTTLLLFALVLPMSAINLRWMVLGVGRSKAIAVGNVASQALFAVGVLLLVNHVDDAVEVPLLLAVAELAYAAVVLIAVAREFGALRPRIDLAAWRRSLTQGAPLLVNQLSRALILTFNLFLIALVLGQAEAGLYGVAYKPVLFATLLCGLLFNAFLASYSAAHPAQAKELLRRTVRAAVLVTVPVALALSIGAHAALTTAFGDAYGPAAVALAILSWGIVVAAAGGAYSNVLVEANEQVALMRHNVAGAILNIAAGSAAIPLAGIEGAAAVALASEVLVTALNYRTSARLGLSPAVGSILRRKPAPAPMAEL